MMKELAVRLKTSTGKKYYWRKRKIKFVTVISFTHAFHLLMNYSCLAHVINLVTQSLISTYSKSPHFDPKQPNAHVPTSRDKVGLIRSIVVKVWIIFLGLKVMLLTAVQERSSLKRKEMWKTIQIKLDSQQVVQLILDMKVWWSSTYLMLDRAKRKKDVHNKILTNDQSFYYFSAVR